MIKTDLLLQYIVKSKRYIRDIAGQLNLSEIAFIKRVGNMADFTYEQINTLCDVLHIPQNETVNVFYNQQGA